VLFARAVLDGGCVDFGRNCGHFFFIGVALAARVYARILPLSGCSSDETVE
jgi:hypothetical protein